MDLLCSDREHHLRFFLSFGLLLVLGCAQSALGDDKTASGSASDLLSLEQARVYMVSLINRDRQSRGRPPVRLDPIASRAGQLHCDDLIANNFFGHYDLHGRKPDQRYTDAGGTADVSENVGSSTGTDRTSPLSGKSALFPRQRLQEIESGFINELAPDDMHKQNILDTDHNGVGIGLGYLVDKYGRFHFVCAQEFTNNWGTFSPLPHSIKTNETFRVQGLLAKGLDFDQIQIGREPLPTSMSADAAKAIKSYARPEEIVQTYAAKPYESPTPVLVFDRANRAEFAVVVAPTNGWKPGLYYVVIWAQNKSNKHHFTVSTRTIECD